MPSEATGKADVGGVFGIRTDNALVLTGLATFGVVKPEANRGTLAFRRVLRILRGFCYTLLF